MAALANPAGLALDSAGNLFIADMNNHCIRRVATNGNISTVAGNGQPGFSGDGGAAIQATLAFPSGVALDSNGNLFIADLGNRRVRVVNASGVISTYAGTGSLVASGDGGPALSAGISQPQDIALDVQGNLYIADPVDYTIRRVNTSQVITTIAGVHQFGYGGDAGPAVKALLTFPRGVSVDASGNVYFADLASNRIRKINPSGIIYTIVGNGQPFFGGDGGAAVNAGVAAPSGTAVDSLGQIYLADTDNQRVRKVNQANIISTIAGSGQAAPLGDGGPARSAFLERPTGLAADAAGDLFVADVGDQVIREIKKNGTITTVAGNGTISYSGDGGAALSASFAYPTGVAIDTAGNLFIADRDNHRIRRVNTSGVVTTVAGNGVGGYSGDGGLATGAMLAYPNGVAVDSAGNLYIADTGNQRIRYVTTTGAITTLAGGGSLTGSIGDGGKATLAVLNSPYSVAVDGAHNVYIADTGNNRIRRVDPNGIINTIAGNGQLGYGAVPGPALSASFNSPDGVILDASGNLYIADQHNSRVLRVDTNGTISTFAGTGQSGFAGDGGLAVSAEIQHPGGLATDVAGNFYIADTDNNRIREVYAGPVSYQATPATLSFSASAGGSVPAAQTINLTATVAGLALTASSNSSWLSVSPASGSIPSVLQVNVDPSGLTAGSYSGTITITTPNAVPMVSTVTVTLIASAAMPATLGVSTQNVIFTATQGSGALAQQLQVTNTGGGALSFSATASGGSWLSLSATNGTATPSSPASLTITATPGSLAAGTYSGTVAITGTGNTINIPVTLSVSAPTAVILVSQVGLSFTAVQQGGAPLSQSLGILNTGQGTMNWNATASTLAGGPWLSIDQTSGTVSMPFTDVSLVNVGVNPSGLTTGIYYGQVQVTSAGAANTPQSVSVLLNVLPPGANPGAQVQPTGLIFIGTPGNSPGSQNVTIGNPQSSAITFGGNFFTVPTGGNWVQVLPTNATVQPNAPSRMVVQPDYSILTSGVYQGFVSLGFVDGTSRTVHVLAVVAPPGVTGSARQGGFASRAASGCTTLLVHPTALTDPGSSVTVGQPASLQARVVDNCGNVLTTGSLTATFSNGDSKVDLVHVGNGNWSGTWVPRNATQPSVNINLAAFGGQGNVFSGGGANLTVALVSSTAQPLTLGAANAASGVGTYISPGGLVSIYGVDLADTTVTSSNVPFPTRAGGAQVLMGGKALPLRFVGANQVNAQVPFDLNVNTAQQLLVQRDNALSVPQDVVVAAAQPGIYTQDQSGTGPGVIVEGSTYQLITASNPAAAGDVLVIYCNGLGAVNPPVPTGTPAPLNGPLSQTVNPVTVTIGGVNALVQFAGLAPGYPDLYQVNAVVPAGVASGAAPVVLTVAGQSSPAVTMALE